jgi:hypothetical protein
VGTPRRGLSGAAAEIGFPQPVGFRFLFAHFPGRDTAEIDLKMLLKTQASSVAIKCAENLRKSCAKDVESLRNSGRETAAKRCG